MASSIIHSFVWPARRASQSNRISLRVAVFAAFRRSGDRGTWPSSRRNRGLFTNFDPSALVDNQTLMIGDFGAIAGLSEKIARGDIDRIYFVVPWLTMPIALQHLRLLRNFSARIFNSSRQ